MTSGDLIDLVDGQEGVFKLKTMEFPIPDPDTPPSPQSFISFDVDKKFSNKIRRIIYKIKELNDLTESQLEPEEYAVLKGDQTSQETEGRNDCRNQPTRIRKQKVC